MRIRANTKPFDFSTKLSLASLYSPAYLYSRHMEPITFRPTEETRRLLREASVDRPGVPRTYIINEAIKDGIERQRRSRKRVQEVEK